MLPRQYFSNASSDGISFGYSFVFGEKKFEKIQTQFKKAVEKNYTFKTTEEAKEEFAKVSNNPDTIFIEYERWQEFDGFFYIYISDDNFSKSSKIEKEIINFIRKNKDK